MKRLPVLTVITMLSASLSAQEYLGIVNSNYAGILGAGLNPSSFVDSKLKFDINIASGGVTFDNTFLYIPKEDLTFFGFGNIVDIVKDKGFNDRFDINNPNDPQNFTLSTEVIGPSFMINFERKYSLGFTTGGHFFQNLNNIPAHVAKNAYEDLGDESMYDIRWESDDMDVNIIGWFEYGISYGMLLYEHPEHQLKGGINLKLLNGVGAGFIKNADADYIITGEDTILFTSASFDYGRTNYNSFDPTENYRDLIHGGGFGWDIGFTYQWLRDSSEWTYEMDQKRWLDPDKNKYKVRIGASLIDMGSIKFDEGSGTYHIEGDSSLYLNWRDDSFEGNENFDESLSYIFYGDSTASFRDDNFKMAMPAGISLQADWNVYKELFVNLTLIQGFGHKSGQGIKRPNIYSITPRYEHRWFEVALPLSLMSYDRVKPRIGLALRAGPVFFGSDQIGALLGLTDLEGADFYMGVKVNIPPQRLKDTDGDKVSDKKDKCPEVPGSVLLAGCPDRDNDGIEDALDECPDVPGVVELKGCPDRDSDGITDAADRCPDDAGLPQFDGCPDRDEDGIPDYLDDCPDAPGLQQFNGCPDTDNDGIQDKIDSCVNDPGPISTNGCPDRDGDLVPDHKDRCPDEPGVVENQGCPPIKEDVMQRVQMSAKAIQFQTGSAVIKGASFEVLNIIAEIMQQYSYTKWMIEGHTDNVGSEEFNLGLSQKRAASVREYFISKGVNPERLTSAGYGESRPIESNKTSAGRAKNRRTEIKLVN